MIPEGTLLDEAWAEKFEEFSVDEIKVRAPITCKTHYGYAPSVTVAILREDILSMKARLSV